MHKFMPWRCGSRVVMLLLGVLLAVMWGGIADAADAAADSTLEPPGEEEIYPLGGLASEHQQAPSLRDEIQPSPLVDRLISDPLTSSEERVRLHVFHGRWDDLPDENELSPNDRALLALQRFELDHPTLLDEAVDPLMRSQAALHRGEPEQALQWLDAVEGAQAAVLRARAHEQLGQLDKATNTLRQWQERAPRAFDDAAEQTADARVMVMLAQLEGRPARDYQLAMNRLADARQQLDPLHWPTHLAEAELLLEKDNLSEAVEALQEALALNPRSGEAWHLLGRLSARSFNFDQADEAIRELRDINEHHLLADLLEVHMRLVQRDPHAGRATLQGVLQRHPHQREAHALRAAVEALSHDDMALEQALEAFDTLAPGSPDAHLLAGEYLSLAKPNTSSSAIGRGLMRCWPATCRMNWSGFTRN